MSEKIKPFSPKELSRLGVFHHIANLVNEHEQNLDYKKPRKFGTVDENGKVTDPYFEIDGKFLNIWNHVLFNMYDTEFRQEPRLKEAANNIIEAVKYKDDPDQDIKALTPGQMNDLFEEK